MYCTVPSISLPLTLLYSFELEEMQFPIILSMLLNVKCSLGGMSSQLYVLHIGYCSPLDFQLQAVRGHF